MVAVKVESVTVPCGGCAYEFCVSEVSLSDSTWTNGDLQEMKLETWRELRSQRG